MVSDAEKYGEQDKERKSAIEADLEIRFQQRAMTIADSIPHHIIHASESLPSVETPLANEIYVNFG